MSTIKVEFWNSAEFYRYEIMPLTGEQVDEVRGYLQDGDWGSLDDFLWEGV